MIITIRHVRIVGGCVPGLRSYCQRFGIDYKSFVKHGIEANELLRITNNDHLAVKAVEAANEWV